MLLCQWGQTCGSCGFHIITQDIQTFTTVSLMPRPFAIAFTKFIFAAVLECVFTNHPPEITPTAFGYFLSKERSFVTSGSPPHRIPNRATFSTPIFSIVFASTNFAFLSDTTVPSGNLTVKVVLGAMLVTLCVNPVLWGFSVCGTGFTPDAFVPWRKVPGKMPSCPGGKCRERSSP